MKINNKNISIYNASLKNRIIYTNNYNSITRWLDGAVNGETITQYQDWRQLNLTFLIVGNNEDEAYKKISLLSNELKNSVIEFDDINLKFNCVLQGSVAPVRCDNGCFKVGYILKNDVAIGNNNTLSFIIDNTDAIKINLKYWDDREKMVGRYSQCFDFDDLHKELNHYEQYIDRMAISSAAAASNDWEHFFLALGVDINKYKPKNGNYYNGEVQINLPYSVVNAINLFNTQTAFDIYYSRYHQDGVNEMPDNVTYPNTLLMTTGDCYFKVYFDNAYRLDNGKLSVVAKGKFYSPDISGGNQESQTTSYTKTSYLIGAPFNIYYQYIQSYIEVIVGTSISSSFNTSTKGYCRGSVTLDPFGKKTYNLTTTPVAEYASKQLAPKSDGGFYNAIFNDNIVETGKEITSTGGILTEPVFYVFTSSDNGTPCDDGQIGEIKLYYNDILINDFVPVSTGNIKNCFVNQDYGMGLYDAKTMTFTGYYNEDGDAPIEVPTFMPLPEKED